MGFVPPLVLLHAQNVRAQRESTSGYALYSLSYPISVPWWPNVVGTAVLVPLVAMLVAALMTRRRQEYRTMTVG